MTALSARLDELEALRAKATPGPWQVAPYEPDGADVAVADRLIAVNALAADAALIVAAVNALPGLLAAVRERDALRAAVEGLAAEFEDVAGRSYGRPDWRARFVAERLRALLAAVDGGGQ